MRKKRERRGKRGKEGWGWRDREEKRIGSQRGEKVQTFNTINNAIENGSPKCCGVLCVECGGGKEARNFAESTTDT